jgi:Zn-dependent metalloprotease
MDNNWTAAEFDNTNKTMVPLCALKFEKTYDHFSTKHTRNSYDNAGCYKSYMHYGVADNAYWNGSVMTYGDGSGTNFDVLTSLDSGEIGHAICEKTANLAPSQEP